MNSSGSEYAKKWLELMAHPNAGNFYSLEGTVIAEQWKDPMNWITVVDAFSIHAPLDPKGAVNLPIEDIDRQAVHDPGLNPYAAHDPGLNPNTDAKTGPKLKQEQKPNPKEEPKNKSTSKEGESTKANNTQQPLIEKERGTVVDAEKSVDGKRTIEVTEEGECLICESPCDDIKKKYKRELDANKEIRERLDRISKSSDAPEAKIEQYKEVEQELAEIKKVPTRTLNQKIETLRSGKDVVVASYEEAKELLNAMPDLRPQVDIFPSNSGGEYHGSIFSDLYLQPRGTYRGDLFPLTSDLYDQGVIHASGKPLHKTLPHYNILFNSGEKAAILIEPK